MFLTVCTKHRQQLLANATAHQALVDWWRQSARWLAGKYVILPDHVHLFCAPAGDEPLQRWVAFWKNRVARQLNLGTEAFWQRDFWDVQMRSSENYATQWEYIRYNPVRHGLTETAETWPYQGEIHVLDWIGD